MPHKLTAPVQIDQEHFLDKLLEASRELVTKNYLQAFNPCPPGEP
jgi:hypothetical protein